MMVLRHCSALWVIGLAAGTQNELLRYFLLRSSVTVGTVEPLLPVGAAYAFNLNRFGFFISVGLAAFSAGLTCAYVARDSATRPPCLRELVPHRHLLSLQARRLHQRAVQGIG
jgi:hypothetical protein